MKLLIIGVVLMLICIILISRDPRRFRNALLFFVSMLILVQGSVNVVVRSSYARYTAYNIIFYFIVPMVSVIMGGFLIYNGFIMIKKEGRRLQNLLSLFLGIGMIAGLCVMGGFLFLYSTNPLVNSILWTGTVFYAYFSYTFLAFLIYSKIYMLLPKNRSCDYIVVHGCGLLGGERISPLLKGRVDKAVEIFYKMRERPELVLSGGQGSDEKITEARAMYNYLEKKGFPEDKMILEEKSRTTYENLKYVRNMLDSERRKHRYIFVTNDYHVFRTSLFARKLKMKAEGVGCKTANYYWPSAIIREYIAIMVIFKKVNILFAVIWLIWSVLFVYF